MIEQIVKDYTKNLFNSPASIREKLNFFREISEKGFHNLSEKEIEEIKASFIKFVNINMTFWADTYPTKLFRVTNNKHLYQGAKVKLQLIDDLLGPPLNKSYYGRCNLPNESVFYSALDFKTAIWETKPNVGDLITVSEWEIKKGEKLNTHNIFNPNINNLSKESIDAYNAWINSKNTIDPNLGEIFEDVMLFFTEEFMKIVIYTERENYLFSSILSSRFLQAKKDAKSVDINVPLLKELAKYQTAMANKSITELDNVSMQNDFLLKEFAVFNKALLLANEGKFNEAKTTLALIPQTSKAFELAKLLNHYLLTK